MDRKKLFILVFFLIISASLNLAAAEQQAETLLMSQPALSAERIAFIYAEDLWTAGLDGSNPRRLTVDAGIESNPVFSPDGGLIAFNAEYDGNTDVYVMPAGGGLPKRLTWHPGADLVRGFTPDSGAVLFVSQRQSFTGRYWQLYTVPVTGGFPERLVIPNAWQAAYAPDGSALAYTPLPEAFRQWKNYRGGTTSNIIIFHFGEHRVQRVPQPEERCNDSNPMWAGDRVYFLSDRHGEFNLFAFQPENGTIEQLTDFSDFPILNASLAGNRIIFEQAGALHLFDLANRNSRKLSLKIGADLLEVRPRFVSGDRYIRSADISPSGARAVFNFRGDIITVPAEKGDPRNITNSPGAHEKYPAWSPDGKFIAFFSDESGEYELQVKAQDGRGAVRSFKLPGTGFYAYPKWSPDSKKLTFVDNGRNLYLFEPTSGTIKKIATDRLYVPGAFRQLCGDWSPDSAWIAYTVVLPTHFQQVFLYSLAEGKSYPLTDGLSDATEPVFDRGGQYMYFLASTDAGPVVNWFDQSSHDMRATRSIYLVTLQRESTSPLARESDEEKPAAAEDKKKENSSPPVVKIDLPGIEKRIIDLPVKPGNYYLLNNAQAGEILYLVNSWDQPRKNTLRKYDLNKRQDSEVMELDYYVLSADGKTMLYRLGTAWGIGNAGEKAEPGKGLIDTAKIQVRIEPRLEWAQIFNEAWRVNRDYFYDPNMHGADWPAMREKYARFLPQLTSRHDLNTLIQWMCSELGVGHHRVGGGDRMQQTSSVPGGLLGADYEISNNRYRFRKIYGGLNWNPELRSPLTEPGINAQAGEYLIAVNGIELNASDNLFSFFENTAGKIVNLTIGPRPDGSGARTVQVVPVAHEGALRNRDWVEGNLRRVHQATDGRVAYVYVPNTTRQGHEYFKRYFFPQADKEAIIVDERFNGGGLIADYYIDLLLRRYQSHWHMRYGIDLKTPSASIQGPKVMLIDETAGSGGDMLPWMFRKFEVGTLVGKTTWGGLVGTLGFPELMDGGMVTAPNLAIWTEDGFIVENVGVPPDIEVEQCPGEVIKGRDPQLEKAIDVILQKMAKKPAKKPKRPPYPMRVGQ